MSIPVSPPNAETDERAEVIFFQALKRPLEEREAFLSQECGPDQKLREEVDGLLRDHEKAGTFLDPQASVSPEFEAGFARRKPEEAGDRIGNYKLLQQIGEGGFGVVWMAEQEKPVRRRVALKIIKLGMDTKEVIARFEQERQALAMMEHPYIAKVFDAGATPFGRPFFVMELVRGVKITEFCDQANLSTGDRLGLFVSVCHAVQHAHQKGIIHRDLKPSNILVSMHDTVVVPKVIDFGVAKATQPLGGLGALSLSKRQQRLTDLTLFTQFEQMVGTPLYMSPEQAQLSGLDIDTRSDIYSLGVLLYELLTGRTPFDPKEMMCQGLDEIRRVIREQEPQKPSTFVSTMALDLRTSVAQHRQTDITKLTGQIRGDLDWIVMKALEKDRTRRYKTANGLAKDIERHLLSEPVQARPPTQFYRFRRFAKRNKVGFAAATSVAVALIAGMVVSAWQAIRATRAEAVAKQRVVEVEQARQEAKGVSDFLTDVFQSPDPSRNARTITVAEMLDHSARKLETNLASQPARQAQLRGPLAWTYRNLGLHAEALLLLEKVRDYYLGTVGLEHPETLTAMARLAFAYDDAGRRAEALEVREEVLKIHRKKNGPEHRDTLQAMNDLAISYDGDPARQDEALEMREKVLEGRRKLFGPEHLETHDAMNTLAISYEHAGRHDQALKMREKVLEGRRKWYGHKHRETLTAMSYLAFSYAAADRPDDALKMREKVLELRREVLGLEHPDTLWAMTNLAISYHDSGRPDEALKLREEVLEVRRRVSGDGHPHTITAIADLAASYEAAGRLDEARTLTAERKERQEAFDKSEAARKSAAEPKENPK